MTAALSERGYNFAAVPTTGISIRSPVLSRENVPAIGSHSAVHVGVGIAHFIARRAVADDEQEHILGGPVDEPMRIAGYCREAGAHARAQRFDAGIGLQIDFALEDIDELILPRVRVAGGGLTARNDARDIHAEIRETGVIAETTVPALLVSGAVRLRITRRVAFW
jgi:hypothetical protein